LVTLSLKVVQLNITVNHLHPSNIGHFIMVPLVNTCILLLTENC
jgi:hypothetical protein